MRNDKMDKVESTHLNDFAKIMQTEQNIANKTVAPKQTSRLNFEPDDIKNGLGQLVLTLVKLLHELMERQAIRRMESDVLSEVEIERLGITLMRQAEEIERLRQVFGLEPADLNLDLGPLGKLL
jgi:hypothetical protein